MQRVMEMGVESLCSAAYGGVKLVTSDAHVGIKAGVAEGLKSTWQRCRVHSRAMH